MRIPIRKSGRYSNIPRDPHMTQEKFDELTAELARLKQRRPAAASEVRRLAELGDFSENAEYQIAKGKLRGMNQRILELEDHLQHAEIITPAVTTDTVRLGSQVTIAYGGTQQTYRILGSTEADPARGIISHQSPLGQALLGKQAGTTVAVMLGGYQQTVEIVRVH